VLVLHESDIMGVDQQEQQQQEQHKDAVQQSSRPTTPDTTDELPAPVKAGHQPSSQLQQHLPTAALGSSNHDTGTVISSSSSSSSKALSWQQLRGLQLLVASATCHREVAAALVEAGAKGPADFAWGQQLRHYYQEEDGQLQV
jgi:hypothetical protein